ncbi:unnamed protein product, partial [Closterium sp. NIES-65]
VPPVFPSLFFHLPHPTIRTFPTIPISLFCVGCRRATQPCMNDCSQTPLSSLSSIFPLLPIHRPHHHPHRPHQFVLDADELPNVPVYGEQIKQFMDYVPKVREDEIAGPAAERFLAPVVLPNKINRLYIKFGAPIRTAGMRDVLTDQQAAAALYAHVKGEVKAGIEYLLRKREEDPYADLGARLLYEATWGGERQAPTFKP